MLKKILIALTIILIIVNTYVITYYSLESRRILRLSAIIAFLSFYLIFKGFSKSKSVFAVLIAFLLSDVFGFYFENPMISKFIYFIRILGYILLIKMVFKKIKIEKVKPITLIIFSVVTLLNLYLLYILVENATKDSNDLVEYSLIIVYGITVVVTIFVASNYNLRYNSMRSTYFFYAALTFVLSDLSWFSAYFLKYKALFYGDVVFYFIGLYCIINYVINTKESDDILLTEESS